MFNKYLINIIISLKISLTCFSNLNRRENPRINMIVVDLVMVTLERNVTYNYM